MQLLAEQFGGEVIGSEEREFGHAEISFDSSCPLFTGINSSKSVVWMSHGDRVNNLPEIFEKVAQTENSPFCAISHKEKPIFGIQFHPEVHHSQDGKEILKGFLQVCQIAQNWEPGKLESI